MATTPSFWLLSFGAASRSIMGYGLIFWLPSFFNRSHGLDLADVRWFYGSIVLVGGIAGPWLGGWFADRTGPARPGSYALIPAISFLIVLEAHGADSLLYSILYGLGFYLLSAAIYFVAAKRLERDWHGG